MKMFGAALATELMKLLARKKFIVFLVLEVLICGMTMLVELAIETASGMMLGFNLRMILLGFFISFYIPLVSFMGCCDLFSSEVQDGSLRAALLRPASRFKVFTAKVLAVYVVAVVYLFSLFVTASVLELAFGSSLQGLFSSLGSYVIDAIPLAVTILMAALLNQLVRSPTLAMLISIVVVLAMHVLNFIYPQLGAMLFTSYSQWHNLFIGKALPFGAMMMKIGMMAGYGILFFCGGYYIFERKDM